MHGWFHWKLPQGDDNPIFCWFAFFVECGLSLIMDSLTHVVTGAVVARAIDGQRIGSWGMVAGLAMGAFPDSDFVLGLFNRQFYLQFHRDFTHSLILIPLYALFFSWLFVKISKRPHFWSFYKICLPVLVSHVLLDLLTSYGTMIFSPFSDRRFAWDLVFIIDLIFSGIVFVPWVASLFLRQKAKRICRGSLIGLGAYVLFCWFQHHYALQEAKGFANSLRAKAIQIAALPQPVSPFRWSLYVETEKHVFQGFVDLRKKDLPTGSPPQISFFKRLDSLYYPKGRVRYHPMEKLPDSPWVERALATEGIKFYYWFARFPVVKSIDSKNGRYRVDFMDLRFFLPGIRLPFVYFVEFDESGQIQSEGFAEEGRKL